MHSGIDAAVSNTGGNAGLHVTDTGIIATNVSDALAPGGSIAEGQAVSEAVGVGVGKVLAIVVDATRERVGHAS